MLEGSGEAGVVGAEEDGLIPVCQWIFLMLGYSNILVLFGCMTGRLYCAVTYQYPNFGCSRCWEETRECFESIRRRIATVTVLVLF